MDIPQIISANFSLKEFKKHNDYIFEIIKNTKIISEINSNNNLVILISGPSGSGKDSIVNLLPNNFKRIKTCTTRSQRPEEINNDPYIRLTLSEFQKSIKNKEFLETDIYDGNYYGSKISEIKKVISSGKIPILRINPTGAKNVMRMLYKNSQILNKLKIIYFYIVPPSKEILRQRIIKRDVENLVDKVKRQKALINANKRFESTVLNDLKLSKYAHYIVINYDNKLNEVTDSVLQVFNRY